MISNRLKLTEELRNWGFLAWFYLVLTICDCDCYNAYVEYSPFLLINCFEHGRSNRIKYQYFPVFPYNTTTSRCSSIRFKRPNTISSFCQYVNNRVVMGKAENVCELKMSFKHFLSHSEQMLEQLTAFGGTSLSSLNSMSLIRNFMSLLAFL